MEWYNKIMTKKHGKSSIYGLPKSVFEAATKENLLNYQTHQRKLKCWRKSVSLIDKVINFIQLLVPSGGGIYCCFENQLLLIWLK